MVLFDLKNRIKYGSLYRARRDLCLRYDVLSEMESNDEWKTNNVFEHLKGKNGVKKKLLTTDFFVENDISILTKRVNEHRYWGSIFFLLAITIFSFGVYIALSQMLGFNTLDINIPIKNGFLNGFFMDDYVVLITSLFKSFTVYGLLVLLGVTLWKQSKTQFDQSERIFEKRRADRILRLFIHLNDGKISLNEMHKILQWGTTSLNAFSSLTAEGKTPIGGLVSEVGDVTKSVSSKGRSFRRQSQ